MADIVTESVQEQIFSLKKNLDQQFKIFISIWIIFMQCGFALLEAGSVRSKNTTNILFKNFLDVFVGALSYWVFGFAFAYGVPGNAFIGHNYFFSRSVSHREILGNMSYELDIGGTNSPEVMKASEYYSSWFFHFAFAATASTIVSGAMAERTQFVAYLIYSFVITGYIYPVMSHWCWSDNGFLHTGAGLGVRFIDFAGSGVVHVTGGTAALVGAIILGPRIGRFSNDDDDDPEKSKNKFDNKLRGHSVPLASMGGFILFAGFLAFNGGSQSTISNGTDGVTMSMSVVNTIISASSGGLSALVFNIIFSHFKGLETYWSLIIAINGGLAGMVSVCASSNDAHPWAAVVIGTISGVMMVVTEHLLIKHRIDDPIGAIPVHLAGGLIGVLLAPFFVIRGLKVDGTYIGGILLGGHGMAFASLGWNIFGTLCIIFWTGMNCLVVFTALKMMGLLRVTENEELLGLDIKKHGEPAYPETYHLLTNENDMSPKPPIRPYNRPASQVYSDNERTFTVHETGCRSDVE
uniref:putative ammonium transporter 1 n=1 Tax=Styela clava TaxID=7725 RepID=UPI00193A09A0|nr:putative ammonium transporter 1 [Styela clava]